MLEIGIWSNTPIDTERKAEKITKAIVRFHEFFHGERPEVTLEVTPPGHAKYHLVKCSEGIIKVASKELWPTKTGRFIFGEFEITPRSQKFATSLAYVISSLYDIELEIESDISPEIIRFTPTDEETMITKYLDEDIEYKENEDEEDGPEE